ncbi:hypothetical protein BASA81_004737 [Batrachochytrium salamandrivorans]|nr:hypothetical protein BASA81_004737 [Batrachochytrium salamandrivorans]
MEFEERVYEVEKLGEGGEYSREFLVELEDGPAWFEARSGRALGNGLEDVQPPVGWKWTSNWKVDGEGWVVDKQMRRRKWLRKRERISSSSSATTSSSSVTSSTAHNGSTAALGEATALRVCTDALYRLDECIQRLSAASGKRTIEGIVREGREAIADCQKQLDIGLKGPPKIKIANDLARDQKRFELAVQGAFLGNAGGKAMGGGKRPTSTPFARNEEGNDEEEERQQQQQQQLQQQLQQQVLSNEVRANAMMIESRHKEIVEIHKMTHQVNDMMRNLAGMVAEQGEDIAQIKQNTSQTKANVNAGLVQVEKAEQYQKDGATCRLM